MTLEQGMWVGLGGVSGRSLLREDFPEWRGARMRAGNSSEQGGYSNTLLPHRAAAQRSIPHGAVAYEIPRHLIQLVYASVSYLK